MYYIIRLAHIYIFCYRWLYFGSTPLRNGEVEIKIQIPHLAFTDTQVGGCFALFWVGFTSNSRLPLITPRLGEVRVTAPWYHLNGKRGTSLLTGGGISPDSYGLHCHYKFEGSSLPPGRDKSLGSLVQTSLIPLWEDGGLHFLLTLHLDKYGRLSSAFVVGGGEREHEFFYGVCLEENHLKVLHFT